MFGLSRKRHRHLAIFDIGSSSVGIAVVKVGAQTNTSAACEILFSNRTRNSSRKNPTFQSFLKEMLETLESTALELAAQKIKIDQIEVFLSSPFYFSQTNIFKNSTTKPFVVTNKNIQEKLDKSAEDLRKKHPRLYSEMLHDETVVLDNKLMQVKMNGYPVTKYHQRKTNDLELNQYVSLGSAGVLQRFKETIFKHLGKNKINFHSFSLVAYLSLLELQGNNNDFVILDITGELSDLVVAQKGVLIKIASFPRGRNWLLRELAKKFSTTENEAYTTLELHLTEKLDKNTEEKLETTLIEIKNDWFSELEVALKNIMEEILLPEKFYLIGDDAITNIFSLWLKDERLKEFSLVNRPPETKSVNIEDVEDFCQNKSGKNDDPFFQIEALFCQKVL